MIDRTDNPGSGPTSDSLPERPTLKTLAAATGLAIATVSRALKDAPDIGGDTKQRVREAARLLGYRPNRAGVRLRTGKTNVIALVLSAEPDVMNHTSRLIYSIAEALRGTAYHLIVTPFFPEQDPMEPVRYIVETESADGIILNQTRPDDPRIRYMAERGFPYATHGRTDMGIDHPFFDFDNEAYARIGVAALVERRRRRLMLIPPRRGQTFAGHMIAGFSDAAAELGVTFEVAEGITSDMPGKAVEEAVLDRMQRMPRPDGFLVGSTVAAMAAIAGAERAGLVTGRDFDLVAKEAIGFLHRFRRDILVVREDVGRAGGFVARALVKAIEARDRGGRGTDAPADGRFPPGSQGLEVPTRVETAEDSSF
ncbi:MAG: substrate-binding domain-containing protein [Paracoccaceae bacterium]|nr:MAG: substrate-binding domain-containing protein [Paracoccaceae bacterium]